MHKNNLEKKIASGSLVAMVANVIYLFSRLLITPFILMHVSIAEYGLWAFCFVILSYAGMSAFGINNAYIKYTAEYYSSGAIDSINGLLSTGLIIMGGISVFFFGILYITAHKLILLFDISPELVNISTFLLIGTASVFLIDLTLGAFRGVLEGMQEIVASKTIWLITTLQEVVLIAAFLVAGLGIKGVLYAYIVKTLTDVLLNMLVAFKKLPKLRLSPAYFDKRFFSDLFVFGGKVQVLGILGMFLGSLDRIITTALLGLDATGLFEVGRKLPFTARSITGAASTPFLPAASALGGIWQASPYLTFREKSWKYGSLIIVTMILGVTGLAPWFWQQWEQAGEPLHSFHTLAFFIWGVLCIAAFPAIRTQWALLRDGEYLEAQELQTLYLRGSRYLNLINFTIYSFVIAAAPQLLFAWVGAGYDEAYSICFAIAIMCLIHLSTLPCSSIMRGINRSGRELEAVLINLILMLLWAPAWTQTYGLLGTVWGLTLSTSISSLHFILRTNLAFRISFSTYWRHAILPGVAPIATGGMIFVLCQMLPEMDRWTTLACVALLGSIYLFICLLLMQRFTLSTMEWKALTTPILRKLHLATDN